MPIAVVTDSTAYLPEGWAEQFAVRTVPLQVNVGGAGAVAESDFTPRELTRALERKQRVTTSGAASEELAKAYQAALDDGVAQLGQQHVKAAAGLWPGRADVPAGDDRRPGRRGPAPPAGPAR